MDSTNSIVSISELKSGWKTFVEQQALDNSKVRPIVAASWERCRNHRLDPYENSDYAILGSELKSRIRENQLLIKIARPFMENIYQFVQGSGFQVVLTDLDGYILEVIGDRPIVERSKTVHLIPGGNWNEQVKGTNAIGTAIVEKAPVQIYAMEHYLKDNHFLTCSAAPIFDPDGHLCGVLDVSGDYRYVNPHTLGMVVAAVTAIESQLRLRKATSNLYFAYKYSSTIMESMAEGLLSIDNSGVITSINSMGSKILELKPEECIGKTIKNVFKQSLPLMDILETGGSYEDKEVKLTLHGKEKLILSTATPLINESGQTIGAVAVLREQKTILKAAASETKGGKAKYTFEHLIGESPLIKEAIRLAQKSAHTIAPILLQGESGTGKELFAQAIHNYGPTKERPFVAINCAAIPKELIESELFGYEEGAFTGAKKGGRPGKFEIAHKGTLFLDEIGDMPLETQAKLLRVLQEKALTRVGGHKEIPIDVRIIAATHRDLSKAVEEGVFRLDLFYRINVLPIHIPALRERNTDIVLLAKHLIEKLAFKMKQPIVSIRPGFFETLQNYHWPGNIRELENVLERAIMLSEEGCLGTEQLPHNLLGPNQQMIDYTANYHASQVLSLKEVEKQTIKKALFTYNGNITKAAEKLGIGRNTLYRKLKEYEVSFDFDTAK